MWKGRTIDSLTFGELRAACRELRVLVSADRNEMEKRVFNAIERAEFTQQQEASQNGTSKRRMVRFSVQLCVILIRTQSFHLSGRAKP